MAKKQKRVPKVRDVLSQIARHLQTIGYTKTLQALEEEGAAHGVDVDAYGWSRLLGVPDGIGPTTLDEFWASILSKTGSAPSLDHRKNDPSLASDYAGSGKGGAGLVDDEAEETSDDSSDEDVQDDSVNAGKGGQKRKRELTPDSSSDSSSESSKSMPDANAKKQDASDSSDSDSDSDSSSSESDRRPVKRTKVSSEESDSSSDSESSSSDSGVYSICFC